ncbi:MAG: sigma-70 family RNA polymerase sigma factor [Rhizobiales bacterium]|nr:sigma-70 family RNA polymerase sigma factor [Hyphomicrobiales bacterium]NRB14898.1 sigma-70 family RNA polymerase sigma factor [Hyphomicrobiales bacterium]
MKQKIHDIAKLDSGYVIASLMSKLHDLQLCEDCYQDAILAALQYWPKNGVPSHTKAWLITTAHRKALDILRRGQNFRSKQDLIIYEAQLTAGENTLKWQADEITHRGNVPSPHIPAANIMDDEQLKLIFMCCHPALNRQAQIALSLKIIGGLTTQEIASAFLTSETTMAQRLVRAKQKIKAAGISFKLPHLDQLVSRVDVILSTIYFIYNESYVATKSDALTNVNLANEAMALCRNVCHFMPNNAEAKGLLALILLQISRIDARVNEAGEFVTLAQQDRRLWRVEQVSEGKALLIAALTQQNIGKYQLLAAINCCHADAKHYKNTDWPQIKLLYEQLYKLEPSPIILMNVIISDAQTNLADMDLQYKLLGQLVLIERENELANYQPFYAVKADFQIRLAQISAAIITLDKAIQLTQNTIEIAYLTKKRDQLCLH